MTFMIFFIFCWRLFFLPSPPKSRCIIVMSVHPASSEMSLVQTASFVWWHFIQKVHPRKCCPLCYCTVNQKMILGKPWACFHLTITPIRNLFFPPSTGAQSCSWEQSKRCSMATDFASLNPSNRFASFSSGWKTFDIPERFKETSLSQDDFYSSWVVLICSSHDGEKKKKI